MKRFLLVCLLAALLVTPAVFAEGSVVTSDAGLALTWSQRYDTGAEIADVILGLRGGAWIDLMYRPLSILEVGAEIGMLYMSWDLGAGSAFYGDFPITAKASLDLSFLSVDVLAGVLLTMDITGDFRFGLNYLAGARLALGNFYAEADYIIDADVLQAGERADYLRFGVGYKVHLLN